MNKALVIYDNTGKIWSIVYGTDEAPRIAVCQHSISGNGRDRRSRVNIS